MVKIEKIDSAFAKPVATAGYLLDHWPTHEERLFRMEKLFPELQHSQLLWALRVAEDMAQAKDDFERNGKETSVGDAVRVSFGDADIVHVVADVELRGPNGEKVWRRIEIDVPRHYTVKQIETVIRGAVRGKAGA